MPDSTPLPTSSRFVLEFIIADEMQRFVPHDMYSARTSPRLWRTVFERYFGTVPTSETDPRWDELLKKGFPIMRLFD